MTPPFNMRFALFYSLNITASLLVLWVTGIKVIPWLVIAIPAAVSFVQAKVIKPRKIPLIETFD